MSKFGLELNKDVFFKGRKEQLINDFNDLVVKKSVSKPYLTSLYQQTKNDIIECNTELGILPLDGISRLNMEWDK